MFELALSALVTTALALEATDCAGDLRHAAHRLAQAFADIARKLNQ
jgi:hypothetical protein